MTLFMHIWTARKEEAMPNDNQQSIVERPQAEWMHPEAAETTAHIVPPSTNTGQQAQRDEPTGVENVSVDNQPQVRNPENWQEAVDEHFSDWKETPRAGSMQDVVDYLEERMSAIHIPTKEELEKERRRKRTEGLISAIADGASAISNLAFTTQYAPDMYKHENSMTAKWQERYDKLKKERDADADRYYNYALTVGKIKEAQEAKEYQRGRDALKDSITAAKAEHDAKLADIRYKVAVQKLSAAEAAEAERAATRELDRKIKEAKLEETQSRTNKNNRWQPSGGKTGQFTVSRINPQTGEKEYKSVFRSEPSAKNFAATHSDDGWVYETIPTTSTTTKNDKWGQPQTSTTVRNTSTQNNSNRTMPGVK